MTGASGLREVSAVADTAETKARFAAKIAACRLGPIVVGIFQYAPGVTVHTVENFGHAHAVTRLAIVLDGEATVRMGLRILPMNPGSAILIPGRQRFSYAIHSPLTVLYVDIAVDDPSVASNAAIDHSAWWPKETTLLAGLTGFARAIVRRDVHALHHSERTVIRQSVESLMLAVITTAPPLNLDDYDAIPGLLGTAMSHLRRHHSDPTLNVETLAAALGVSARTVQRAFTHTDTVSEHLTLMRTHTALAMLQDPRFATMPVTRISQKAGFASIDTMRRAVRAATGKPLNQCRPAVTEP
ncbi:MAG: helix-turn-helix domain-containing protein [Cellulomonadaceae bacterium]|nr:helix-turn-helix domain-containing protein [Cellulomonadaceae bacterium]